MPPKIVSKDATYVSPLQQLQNKSQTSSKRIRVARACDNCRRRKVKCDGKQPCIHCTVYSYECTYNHFRAPVTNTRKPKKESIDASAALAIPPSQYTQQQQQQQTSPDAKKENVSASLIAALFPEININDDTFNAELFLKILEKHKQNGAIDLKRILKEYNSANGSSSTTARLRNPVDPIEIRIILPPREIALKLIYRTWNDSCLVFRFYHRPSFLKDFNSLYEVNPNDYSNHQNKMLPLIYSVIAVGALFSKGDNAIDNQYLQDEGYKYFIAARKLIDITNSTDLESIQTIFMLTLFLQCSARLSTCYSYIGIALRSALRQGLHRKLETPCNYIKAECKKRLFWTIFKMEIYVNSMLGLPNSIDEIDIDADFPLDVDDQNIDYDVIHPQLKGKLSSCGINNYHTKLILILNHIVQKLYKSSSNPVFTIPVDTIKNLENELKVWVYELPYELKPDVQCSVEYLKANRILYLDYLHVQIMLYRPFINYVKIANQNDDDNSSKTYQYENGLKCFEISKQIINLAGDMINQKLLNGSYWFSIYTIFFSVACLVYYFLEIDSNDIEINKSIEKGKQILSNLKQRSVSAERIYNLLNHMFENYERSNFKIEALDQTRKQSIDGVQYQQRPFTTATTTTTTTTTAIPQNVLNTTPSPQAEVSYPLNQFTSPNNNSLINLPATHTIDQIDPAASTVSSEQQQSSTTATTSAPPTNFDEFDLKIFGNFLPSYMLQQPIIQDQIMIDTSNDSTPINNTDNVNFSRPMTNVATSQFASPLESDNVDFVNALDDVLPTTQPTASGGTVGGVSSGGYGEMSTRSGSVKTDDDDGVFDWERFFDKNDNLNFEI